MSVISTLLLVQSDPGVRAALQFGFEREGVDVVIAERDGVGEAIAGAAPQLVIAGADEAPLEVLEAVRAALADAELEVPVLYLGNGISRDEALAGGASELVDAPAFVRDVVTLGRLAVAKKRGDPPLWVGSLADHFSLYYLMRAISGSQRRCVLTLVRGLRRGELRFYDGEVTSAQAGILHGVAALHQLLLWTEGAFELRPEEVVPRRQIPMSLAELLAASERFLEEVRDVGGGMSPSHTYEASREASPEIIADVPPQIGSVLRLFDGNRTLADVVEDSPYRMFETLRIADRLRTSKLITRCGPPLKPARAATSLAIDAWLRGWAEPRLAVAKKTKTTKKKKKKKKKKADKPAAAPIQWADVMPRPAPQIELEAISQVVPATSATGEVESASPEGRGEVEAEPAPTIEIEAAVIREAEEAGVSREPPRKKRVDTEPGDTSKQRPRRAQEGDGASDEACEAGADNKKPEKGRSLWKRLKGDRKKR